MEIEAKDNNNRPLCKGDLKKYLKLTDAQVKNLESAGLIRFDISRNKTLSKKVILTFEFQQAKMDNDIHNEKVKSFEKKGVLSILNEAGKEIENIFRNQKQPKYWDYKEAIDLIVEKCSYQFFGRGKVGR